MPRAVIVACILWLTTPAHATAAELDPDVVDFLARPQAALAKVPQRFRIVALSNLAEYCANLSRAGELARHDAERCVVRVVELAERRDVSPLTGPAAKAALGDHGLYLAHLAIVLGAYQRVVGDDAHRATSERVARHLAARTLASPIAHAASFAGNRRRWPADQAAVLYALTLHDHNFGTELAREPVERWLDVMATKGTERRWGLHRSELTGRAGGSLLPRGCALSWTTRYMAAFAPDEAAKLWARYEEVFAVDLGVAVGFREWPPGIERAADIDSGPIVAGIGAAASGLAIGAARAVSDDVTHLRLLASASLAGAASDALSDARAGILARAIELSGRTLGAW